MKNQIGCVRGYNHMKRAWYGKSILAHSENLDEVTFGYYGEAGDTIGEITVEWRMLGRELVPCLTVFDDAWYSLSQFQDVLAAMAQVDDRKIRPEQFCQILEACGFKDQTPTQPKNPVGTTADVTLLQVADQLEIWAQESREGGWSTHQVDPQLQLAVRIRETVRRQLRQAAAEQAQQ
jgi:hypothetical protein